MSSRTKALFAIIAAALLWSTAGLSKILVRELDPYLAAFLRFFVASVVILPIFLASKKSKHMIRDLVPISLLATANILFYYIGLSLSTANAATLIYAGAPMLTATLAHMLIGERLNKQKITGILIAFLGILFITAFSVSGTPVGNVFFVIAIVVWSLYTIGSRQAIATRGYSPIVLSSVFFFVTTGVFFLISLFTFKPSYIPVLTAPSTILLILHLGILVTVATYLLYQWAIQHSSATTASLQNYIGPIFSILVNVTFLGETITPGFLAGTALVLTGVIIASGSGLLQEVKDWITR